MGDKLSESEQSGSAQPPTISNTYSYVVLGLLSLVYVFNFVDRMVLSLLIEPIKNEFGVSDTFMGLLTGPAFAIFYTCVGIPIARWADSGNRRNIVGFSLIIWSAMTAASGMVRSFGQLALVRIAVGVGEAGGTPPSHSLLSDYFGPERRGTALSIYAWGVYIGTAIAFIGGGYIVQHPDVLVSFFCDGSLGSNVGAVASVCDNHLRGLAGWRVVFYAVGLPGIPLAAAVFLVVRELPRGFSEGANVNVEKAPFKEVLSYVLSCRSFVFIVLATSVQALSGYGVITWGITFLMRVHHLDYAETGWKLGWLILIAGCGGTFLGGKVMDSLGARDVSWNMRLPAYLAIAGLPFLAGFALLPNPNLALLSFVPFYILTNMYVGPMHAMVQGLVKLRMRATASAFLVFMVSIIGLGIGPLAVGALNDLLAAQYGDAAIRYSLLMVGSLGGFSSILFWQASKSLAEGLAKAAE
jgi:MFS family permease